MRTILSVAAVSIALSNYGARFTSAQNVDLAIRTVALSGQSAPGGGVFSACDSPVINDAGHTAFYATAGVQGLWSEGSGSLLPIVEIGDPAPGIAEATFSNLLIPAQTPRRVVLNDLGHTAFSASVQTRQGVNLITTNTVWHETSTGLAIIAKSGEALMDGSTTGTLDLNFFRGPDLNNQDNVFFMGSFANPAGPLNNTYFSNCFCGNCRWSFQPWHLVWFRRSFDIARRQKHAGLGHAFGISVLRTRRALD